MAAPRRVLIAAPAARVDIQADIQAVLRMAEVAASPEAAALPTAEAAEAAVSMAEAAVADSEVFCKN